MLLDTMFHNSSYNEQKFFILFLMPDCLFGISNRVTVIFQIFWHLRLNAAFQDNFVGELYNQDTKVFESVISMPLRFFKLLKVALTLACRLIK